MMRIILIFMAAVSLVGCLPAVFVVGAAAGGSIIYDHRDSKVMFEDRTITFQVENKINNDPKLRHNVHVSVATFNHIVLLIGQVPSEELRTYVEELVKSNEAIRIVYNELRVGPLLTNTQRANDSWITTKIKTLLLATPGLSSTNLKVVTEGGVVYLMGLTTKKQAELATTKARTVSGVQKVVKLFEYLT